MNDIKMNEWNWNEDGWINYLKIEDEWMINWMEQLRIQKYAKEGQRSDLDPSQIQLGVWAPPMGSERSPSCQQFQCILSSIWCSWHNMNHLFISNIPYNEEELKISQKGSFFIMGKIPAPKGDTRLLHPCLNPPLWSSNDDKWGSKDTIWEGEGSWSKGMMALMGFRFFMIFRDEQWKRISLRWHWRLGYSWMF